MKESPTATSVVNLCCTSNDGNRAPRSFGLLRVPVDTVKLLTKEDFAPPFAYRKLHCKILTSPFKSSNQADRYHGTLITIIRRFPLR
jgi:hypothetical protein